MLSVLLIATCLPACADPVASRPAPENEAPVLSPTASEGSAYRRWLGKPVQHSVTIDDVESLTGWETRGAGRIELTSVPAHEGDHALRFTAPMWNREFFEHHTGPNFFGTTGGGTQAVKVFTRPQDWSAYNRISVWVYVHDTGRYTYNVTFMFTCLGLSDRSTVPRATFNANSLRPAAWNHVVWEIPHLPRDRVTEFIVHAETSGYDSEVHGDLVLDVDQIELQQVEADPWQGWAVAPGHVALSQIGYAPTAQKVALISPTDVDRFEVVDRRDGRVVFSAAPASISVKKTGSFAVLDFSSVRQPGTYYVRAGTTRSEEFVIAQNYWHSAVTKALNFFSCERCGVEVPGIHNACHHDLVAEDGGETKPIFGGWHDAADFTQLTGNTAEATYAMLEMAGQLRLRGTDPQLQHRIEAESRIGLDWLQKTLFTSGRRVNYVEIRHYTDGIRHTPDDKQGVVSTLPSLNFICAATQAKAAIHFQSSDPEYARMMREGAWRDWSFGLGFSPSSREATPYELAWAVLAGVELERLTGDAHRFRAATMERAQSLLECQERTFVDGIPLTGYFYDTPDRRRVSQPEHMCHDEAALMALAALCSAYPDHPEWMRWFSAMALYGDFFLSRGAEYMAPFRYLPNAVYRRSDFAAIADDNVRADQLEQLEAGTRLSHDFYLRAFPIWTTPWARGSTGIQLSRTLALSAAAGAANDPALQQLARWQIEWVFGRNPFAKSLMYGEGHDYMPMHSHRQGEIVGALPVGIDCIGHDEPFWPVGTNRTSKEIWVVPTARFIWATAALALPAHLEGRSDGRLTLVDTVTARAHTVEPDAAGEFHCNLPAGDYTVRNDGDEWRVRLLAGRNYRLDLRSGRGWKARLAVMETKQAEKTRHLRLSVTGHAQQSVALRLFNARCRDPKREINQEAGRDSAVDWEIEIIDATQPWVAVVMPQDNADLFLSVAGR